MYLVGSRQTEKIENMVLKYSVLPYILFDSNNEKNETKETTGL